MTEPQISLSLLATVDFSAYNAILEKIFRVMVRAANISMEHVVRAWVTGVLQNILCSAQSASSQ